MVSGLNDSTGITMLFNVVHHRLDTIVGLVATIVVHALEDALAVLIG